MNLKTISISVLLSFIVNGLVVFLLYFILNSASDSNLATEIPVKFKIENIPLRTFGEKESKGKNFGKSKKGNKFLKVPEKNMSLKDLSPNKSTSSKFNNSPSQLKRIDNNSKRSKTAFSLNSSPPVNPDIANIISNSQLGHRLEAPKGIPFDQLNSLEKIFYIFNKRVFDSFANATISTLNEEVEKHPSLKEKLTKNSYDMSGLASYDRFGNLVSIKITSAAKDDQISMMFESILQSILKIPNPPKDFVKEDEEFRVHYRLKFN